MTFPHLVAGLGGVFLAGWALDRWFRGNWAALCSCMSVGVIAGYVAVINFGGSPIAIAIWFGLVGFMLYGPDTILCGAASVQVAGEKNAIAVAGEWVLMGPTADAVKSGIDVLSGEAPSLAEDAEFASAWARLISEKARPFLASRP